MSFDALPCILIIDDLYGRSVPGAGNNERLDFCRRYGLVDVTGDQPSSAGVPSFMDPVAAAVFIRGQKPTLARRGATVDNDLEGIVERVGRGQGSHPSEPWSLILLDLLFLTGTVTEASETAGKGIPEGRHTDRESLFGLEVLSELSRRFPQLPAAILSTTDRKKVAQEYVSRGAVGYLSKTTETPGNALRTLLDQQGLLPDPSFRVVGRSTELLLALRDARKASLHDRPILILGERGTGKELMARYVHEQRDPRKPFVAINCGQFSDAENAFSALFGHKRGSFTGAVADRLGSVLAAKGGVLFLDEVSSLPLSVQQGVHRLLQEKEVAPFGAIEKPIRVTDVKILAASNLDLDEMVRQGRFLPDLLDRLKSGTVVRLPPLRERFADLPLLVELFVRQEERALAPAARPRQWDRSLYDYLASSPWPGNVRELETSLKQAVSANPDLEILHPRYVRLPPDGSAPPRVSDRAVNQGVLPPAASPFEVLASVDFTEATLPELTGRLRDVLRVVAGYIDAVVRSTTTPSPDTPSGKINLTAVSRAMTGNSNLRTSQPADFVKSLLKMLDRQEVLTDVLKKAYTRARKARKGASAAAK